MLVHEYEFPIESERLYYRPIVKEDTKPWEAFFIGNDQLHFVGISNPKSPAEEAVIWIDRQMKRYEETGIGMLAAIEKKTGTLMGNVGIILREKVLGEDFFEIGYGVIPSYWNKGYASEMAIRLREYFEAQKLDERVVSIISIENIGSQRVAEKNGMKRTVAFDFHGSEAYLYRKDL
ncbi:GNAT family N-acetyltransferase [Roseivirga sp.]|uniref:GNAT family N-acetyltransferase n=1 Tax=Roseivirga sp. TaxID=1964215 RepID=UPI003B8AC0A9